MIFLFIGAVSAISIGIESFDQKCFQFEAQAEQSIKITFVVSGINEDQTQVDIFSPNKELLKSHRNIREDNIKETVKETGEYELCFKNLDSYYKTISFDIDIAGVDKNYANKTEMLTAENTLKRAHMKMQKVYRNQHFQFDREHIHQQLLTETERKVKVCALSKVVVLLVVCLTQIYMLTNFFKDKSFGPTV